MNDQTTSSHDEDEELLPQVFRLEEQPKCLTGGNMRDYQACSGLECPAGPSLLRKI